MEMYLSPKKFYEVKRGGVNHVFYGRRMSCVDGIQSVQEVCPINGPIVSAGFWKNVMIIKRSLFVYSYARNFIAIPGFENVCWDFCVLYPQLSGIKVSKMSEGYIYTSDDKTYVWITE